VVIWILLVGSTSGQTLEPAALRAQLEFVQQQLQQIQQGQGVGPNPSTPAGSPGSLEERLDELSAQIKNLARRIELDQEAAAEKAKAAPQSVLGGNGFSIQSGDGQFRFRLRGYLQSDGRFYADDNQARGVDSFLLRRVRPILETTMYGIFDARIMPDFAGGGAALQDAYVDARLHPAFRIRTGKFKAPVGFERLASATELLFVERALPTALVPNRDLGVMVHGDLVRGGLAYAVGLFNGVTDGGSADTDTEDGKQVAARVFAQPFRTRRDSVLQGLGAGLSASHGVQRGTSAANSGLPSLRTSGQSVFFAFSGDEPIVGPVLAAGSHSRVSVHGHYYYGSFGLLGEHVLSRQQVARSGIENTLDNTAWQVAGTWVLTGETPSPRSLSPRTPFDRRAGTWGAIELTTRYSAIDIDSATFPLFANPLTASRAADAWLAGVNWYLNGGLKLQANFERTTFTPAGAVRRAPENLLLTRLQVVF
jgi:phosphate-selective porin OprO/OprP